MALSKKKARRLHGVFIAVLGAASSVLGAASSVLGAASSVLGAASSEHCFRSDYTQNDTEGGWYKFHRIPAKWHEAELRCRFEGAVLASPLNQDIITSMIELSQRTIYTGIHSTFSKGDFTSIEGVPLSQIPHKWVDSEPNYEDVNPCTVIQTDGSLVDVPCTRTYPYVCYKKHGQLNVTSCGTVDPAYTLDPHTGSCYKFHTTPRTWSRAFMACHAEGGHLAIINSDAEATVMMELFASYSNKSATDRFRLSVAHIGFNHWGEKGEWRTIQGDTLHDAGYDNFSKRSFDHVQNAELCGSILCASGFLNEYYCNELAAFICEKSPDSLRCFDKL